MVSTRRNFNLEEVNTDLIDVPYIKNQSFLQKIIFFGGIIGGIAFIIVGQFVFHLPRLASIAVFMLCAFAAVLFGGNYNQDLTLFQYVKYKLTHNEKYLPPVSTEDAKYIEGKSREIEQKESEKARNLQTRDPAESKRLLRVLLIFLVIIVGAVIAVAVVSKSRKVDTTKIDHRTVNVEQSASSNE